MINRETSRVSAARRNLSRWIFVGVTALCLGGVARATTIDGEIHFWGGYTASGGSGNLGSATTLSFWNPVQVADATGDFVPLIGGDATIHTFQFRPVLNPNPVDPLWEAGGFRFKLENIYIDYQSDDFLNLSGTGVLTAAGYDDTPGTWNFQGAGSGMFFFRADNVAVAYIADSGATLMLLGFSLAGLVLVRRVVTQRRAISAH